MFIAAEHEPRRIRGHNQPEPHPLTSIYISSRLTMRLCGHSADKYYNREMQIQGTVIFLLLACYIVAVCAVDGPLTLDDCVSIQEFNVLENDVRYWQNTTLSLIKNYVVNKNEEHQCACASQLDAVEEAVEQKLDVFLSSLNFSSTTMMPTSFPLGTFLNPAASCKNIPTSSPSGNYWIQSTSTGYATMEYCHMSPPCSCSRASGWMRVAELNMTDPQDHCPSGFRTITSPRRMCGRSSAPGCASITFPVNGVHYSKVCGRIIGYQHSSMDAFGPYYQNQSRTIDDPYVDGISLTHGNFPRHHIWTFADAADELRPDSNRCPCANTDFIYTGIVPPFVGNDYFCDTGSRYSWRHQWYTHDPLWDGEGCGGSSTCCEFNSPPWFCKELAQSTTDDIELRLCSDQDFSDEDLAFEIVDIYVQ